MRSISKFVPFNSSIWKFLTFNTGLPLFDMGTDFRTFFFYLSVASFHPNWAMLTLGWILVPFFLHVCKFLHHLVTTGEAKWKELLLHVPFVLPLRKAQKPRSSTSWALENQTLDTITQQRNREG